MPYDASSDETDDALLARYATGDAAAARALTARLTPRVYGHAYRLLGDRAEAEDVTQEALLRLWRIAPNWREGEAKVSTWLYRVTANLCTDRVRRKRPSGMEDMPEMADDGPGADSAMQERARADALQSALHDLPDRQRQAVVLRHIEELGTPEIAAIMDIGPRAVESLVARGKRALAEILRGRKDELGYTDD
ncbi:ECF RNA polymerase sigma factor SigW [Pseudoprimorskyibacter insulae]|uniref:ECF RNA polymerase sigma factor SigW n=2 Tax=Pseudoprimorskyibacter insulae TaxID=1695997 RepID=A0A2R8APW4_9RHOB|nr:ECF RNA polymerase sigma factor SigW [Pseudoprimorskyibacter insulae]